VGLPAYLLGKQEVHDAMFFPERVFLKPSFKLVDFNLKTIKSGNSFSHFWESPSRLLCKPLSFLTSAKILQFAKDGVVMGTYDDSRGSASKVQIKTC
jgi:hypothetical protein